MNCFSFFFLDFLSSLSLFFQVMMSCLCSGELRGGGTTGLCPPPLHNPGSTSSLPPYQQNCTIHTPIQLLTIWSDKKIIGLHTNAASHPCRKSQLFHKQKPERSSNNLDNEPIFSRGFSLEKMSSNIKGVWTWWIDGILLELYRWPYCYAIHIISAYPWLIQWTSFKSLRNIAWFNCPWKAE